MEGVYLSYPLRPQWHAVPLINISFLAASIAMESAMVRMHPLATSVWGVPEDYFSSLVFSIYMKYLGEMCQFGVT